MPQRANIVSFDAAQRSSAARSRRYAALNAQLEGTSSAKNARSASGRGTRKSTVSSLSLDDDAFWAEIRGDNQDAFQLETPKRSSASLRSAQSRGGQMRGGQTRSAAKSQAGEYRFANDAYDVAHADKRAVDPSLEERFGGEEFDNETANAQVKASKAERKRRKRAKERAGKMFSKQFASEGASDASEGPRAALYEGKMGKTTRRAARLVDSAKASPIASGFSPLSLLSGITLSSRKLVAMVSLVCVVASCVSIYGPAQQYYQSIRDNDRAQAQYAALESRSEALEAQNDMLTSDAGVETLAHKDYGWIKAGEQTATVEGLSEAAYAKEEAGSTITANVAVNNIGYPETWYSPVLDVIFGVG